MKGSFTSTETISNDSRITKEDADSLQESSESDSDTTSFSSEQNNIASANSSSDCYCRVDIEPNSTSPAPRMNRVRTIEVKSPLKHVASSEKVRRNTDSMLEDAFIADKLKRRLGSRRESQSALKTITYTGLSDFIMKSIMEGSLNAISAAMPTVNSLTNATNLAFHSCLAGYFDYLENENLLLRLKNMFMESLERMEFRQGEFICRENDHLDRLFVIEEGLVQLSCGGQVAGTAGTGSILGELSLVYGIPAPAEVKCTTPCVILWSMDALSFYRMQALVAKESLNSSTLEKPFTTRKCEIRTLQRQCSSFLDLQEEGNRSASTKIPFDRLKKIAIIGRGTYGSVYVVEDIENESDARYYSLKCMSKASIIKLGNQKRVLIEKHALLASSVSEFMIKLLGTYQDGTHIYFLTEFVQGGTLMRHMINRDILTHEECVFFTANIVCGLTHLHSRGFVHRDIKPENCLIDRDGYLKLCDLGMAKRLPSTIQLPSGGTEVVSLAFTICGTPEFMAPEFVLSTGYSRLIDWWALGCILVEMYCGYSPFGFDGDLKKTFKSVCLIGMGRETFNPPKEFYEPGLDEAKDFTQRLLSKVSDRIGRHSSDKVEEHRYFSTIDFSKLKRKLLKAPYRPKISQAIDSFHFDVFDDPDDANEPLIGNNDIFKDF